MNRYVSRSAIVTLALIPTFTLLAAEVPNERDTIREKMQDRREQYDATNSRPTSTPSFAERVVERRARFAEAVKNRMKNLLENVTTRQNAVLTRFEAIIVRIEARKTIIAGTGTDVSAVDAALGRARAEIAAARSAQKNLTDTAVDSVIDDAAPKEKFLVLRNSISAVHTHIVATQVALKDAVLALKGQTVVPTPDTATSSLPLATSTNAQ